MLFCGKCGAKLVLLCIKCGFENPEEFAFCGKCGNSLQKTSDTSEIDYKKPESYTPKHLANKILTNRGPIEGERKLVTVLFADVANYTTISERLDPEEVHQVMDGCFKILMEEIHKYEGTINQFTGDGIMALFGAPVAHEDHANRACRAAIIIQKALEQYRKELKIRFDIQFKMRIGINSGLVVVGSIGDDLRMDYTAIGDTTNLASRMESHAKPGTILISEKTRKIVKDFFELKSIGTIEIKGKEKPQKVYQLIRAGDIETRIEASQVKGLTRFVGRKNSMGALIKAFERVKSGSGQVVGIVGEAGVGKSRLLLEMRNMLLQDEFEYVEGRCLQYGNSILYLPILDILKSIFLIKDDNKEFAIKRKINDAITNLSDRFTSLNSSFQDILSLKVDDEEYIKLEPKEKREKVFEAIRDLLIRMSQDKPLVIAVEDLHWIDKTSEEFLTFFIDWLANSQILLILLYRPEYTHQWGSKSFYTKIGVDQLGISSSGDLIKAILEEGEVATELRQLILNRSSGNPLFIEEFTNTLVENGAIEKQENQFALKGNSKDIKVPDTIQGIIAARIDRLEDNLKRTMQVASVIGRDFAFKILQTITGMRTELKAYLLNLQGLEFIYEKNLFPELEYIFKHALTQEVAYNSLLQKRRNEIHEKIGLAIEELYSDRMEEYYEILAYHFSKSSNDKKAVHYLKMSAQKASAKFSHWDAFASLKKAFHILETQIDSPENQKAKIKILKLANMPLFVLGMPDESLWVLDTAIAIAREMENSIDISEFYSLKASYYSHRGDNDRACMYAGNAFEEAKKYQNLDQMVQNACVLSMAHLSTGNFKKISTMVPETIELIEKSKRKLDSFSMPFAPYSTLSSFCGLSMGCIGAFNEGNKYLTSGLGLAYRIKDKLAIGIAELNYGVFYLVKGDWNSALEHFNICVMYAKEVNNLWSQAWCYCVMGYAASMLSNHEEAKMLIKQGLEMYHESGVKFSLPAAYSFSGYAAFESKDYEIAREYLEKAVQLSQTNNEKVIEGRTSIFLGSLICKQDLSQKQDALSIMKKGMKLLKSFEAKPFYSIGHFYLGELFLNTNEPEKAVRHLEKANIFFEEMGMDFWLSRTQKLLSNI
ncbi:MAG: AAA family ATPase [Desulfobacter sp.]|nr:MAG: AAA family ATPase [Desulfobacter sp.]